MFRASGSPTRYTDGFYGFYDHAMRPIMESRGDRVQLVARHIIAPRLAPSDKEAFTQVTQGVIAASEVVGLPYRQRAIAARLLGCATVRMQITPGSKQSTPPDSPLLTWQRDICERVNKEAGEGCRVAWWDEQKDRLADVLSDDAGQKLLDEFQSGITQDRPVGGYWALYGGERSQDLVTIAEVKYRKDTTGVMFEGFDVYHPNQLTAATRRYVDFWNDVVTTPESIALHEMVPIRPTLLHPVEYITPAENYRIQAADLTKITS